MDMEATPTESKGKTKFKNMIHVKKFLNFDCLREATVFNLVISASSFSRSPFTAFQRSFAHVNPFLFLSCSNMNQFAQCTILKTGPTNPFHLGFTNAVQAA